MFIPIIAEKLLSLYVEKVLKDERAPYLGLSPLQIILSQAGYFQRVEADPTATKIEDLNNGFQPRESYQLIEQQPSFQPHFRGRFDHYNTGRAKRVRHTQESERLSFSKDNGGYKVGIVRPVSQEQRIPVYTSKARLSTREKARRENTNQLVSRFLERRSDLQKHL